MSSENFATHETAPAGTNFPMQTRKARWPLFLFGCAIFAAVLGVLVIAIPLVLLRNWEREGQRMLDEEVRFLEQTGAPTTPEELEEYYSQSTKNSGDVHRWLEPFQTLSTKEFETEAQNLPLVGRLSSVEEIPAPGTTWEQLDDARALLAKYRAAIDQLHQAAEIDGPVRYPTEFASGLSMTMDELNWVRNAGRVLKLEAYVRAHDGDSAGALRSIRTMLQLANSLEGYPNLIAHLVRIVVARFAFESIAELLPHFELADSDLQALNNEVSQQDLDGGLRDAFIGERVTGLFMFDHPEQAAENSMDEDDALKLRGAMRWMKRDRAFYLGQLRKILEAIERPWPEKLERATEIEREIQQISEGGKIVQLQHIMSFLLLPAQTAAIVGTGRGVAMRNAAMAAIALERHRKSNGQYPSTLNELVPGFLEQVPMDPFNGQPLRYRVESNQLVIYSVGDNGKDDSGKVDDETDKDYVFAIPARAGEGRKISGQKNQ